MSVDVTDNEAIVVQERLERSGEARRTGRLRRDVEVGDGDFRIEELDFDDGAFCDVVGERRR